MAVAHAPALWSAWGSAWPGSEPFNPLRALLLLGSQALFILKLLDVPWLRLPADRQRLVGWVVCAVLLHAGLLEHALPAALAGELGPVAVLATGAAGAWLIVRTAGRLDARLSRHRVDRQRAILRQLRAHLLSALLPPRFLLLACVPSIHRAPPL